MSEKRGDSELDQPSPPGRPAPGRPSRPGRPGGVGRSGGFGGVTGVAVVLAGLVVLVLTAAVVAARPLVDGVDLVVAEALSRWPVVGREAAAGWRVVTWFGAGAVLSAVGLVAALVLLRRRAWADAAGVLAAMTAVFICWGLLRVLVDRDRPPGGLVAVSTAVGYPSGHATNAAAFALLALLVLRTRISRRALVVLATVVLLFTLLVGLSRVMLAVHYPSDVVAGWALAAMVAPPAYLAASRATRRVRERRQSADTSTSTGTGTGTSTDTAR